MCKSAAMAPAPALLSATQHLSASKHDDTSPSSYWVFSMQQMHQCFWAQSASMQHRSSGNAAAAAPAATQLSATQHLPASKHDETSPSSYWVFSMLHAPRLPPKQMRQYFMAQRASMQHRSSGNSAAAAPAATQLSATQHLPASKHDDTSPSSYWVFSMHHAPHLPPKQMRQYFWAQRVSMQHRSSGNSTAAAPALTQLSATQHLPASKHDDTSPSSYWVFSMLHAPRLPPKQMHHYFLAQRASIQHPQAVMQRPRHQHPRSSLRHSICLHLVMIPKRKAASWCLRCSMLHVCPRSRCANISGRSVRRCSIPKAVIQRPRHQQPRSSLRHSICLHPSMMIHRQAPTGYSRCFMLHVCPRSRCSTISWRNVRRYSIPKR
jgi:hypothetical protein